MAEYIKKSAALEILKKHPSGTWKFTPVYSEKIKAAIREIEALPATAVAPVASGEWIPIKDKPGGATVWICGACCCGREFKTKERFCPDCGSKMNAGGQNAD